jgi:hypothetical protein
MSESEQPVNKAPPGPIDANMENDVSQFVRLDTELKRAKKQMKDVHETINGHRQNIIQYMVRTGTDKLVGINGGTQYLECVHKTLKKRPTSDQMLAKIAELVEANTTNPRTILEAIQSCGGTYTEYRLSRRTRRVNAASAVAAVMAASKKKLRKQTTKKRKLAVTEAV